MKKILAGSISGAAAAIAGASSAFAGVQLGAPLGTSLPIAEGGLLGVVAAAVAGGIWLAKRKG